MAAPPTRPSVAGIAYRLATHDDLVACAGIWRDSINDYTRRLNQPDLEAETGPLMRLYSHLQATDPERFVVATHPDASEPGEERIVGFAAAVQRERLWFLSMCFVRPEAVTVEMVSPFPVASRSGAPGP